MNVLRDRGIIVIEDDRIRTRDSMKNCPHPT